VTWVAQTGNLKAGWLAVLLVVEKDVGLVGWMETRKGDSLEPMWGLLLESQKVAD
jgi:hypothetical protein